MSENCTAEDFAQATFARHPNLGLATRDGGINGDLWMDANGDECDDSGMALRGWVPVVEATEVMQNRQIDAEAHLDQIERLSKRASAAEDQIESQRLVLEDLREENYRLERILQAPLSLRDLEAEWENAEVPTDDAPIREGDVVIYTSACGTGVTAHKAAVGQFGRETHGYVRIMSRAPRREPWADLADSLEAEVQWIDRFNAVDAAKALHEAGWRKGGDDDE